ncbi:MAG: ABC transporter substrate-binding protein [Nitrospirae bacterium]|nr:ABC transporter substrate-binding protein [Nitrospirota bacterium]
MLLDQKHLTAKLITGMALVLSTFIISGQSYAQEQDLYKHPKYSKYQFSKNPKIIDLATQPAAVASGIIVELMKRDNILAADLKAIGSKIRFHNFLNGSHSNFFLTRGDVDAVIAGDAPTIELALRHPIFIPALIKQGSSSIISRDLMTVSDLKGKRIGVTPGTTSEFGLLIVMSIEGLSQKDVNIEPMEITELSSALHRGAIDAFAAWEPTPSNALMKHSNFRVLAKYPSLSMFAFSRQIVEKNRPAALHIIASYIRSLKWLRQNSSNLKIAAQWNIDGIKSFTGEQPKLNSDQISKIVRSEILPSADAPFVPRRSLEKGGTLRMIFDHLIRKTGYENSKWITVQQSIDNTLLHTVLSNPKKYRIGTFDYTMEQGE